MMACAACSVADLHPVHLHPAAVVLFGQAEIGQEKEKLIKKEKCDE